MSEKRKLSKIAIFIIFILLFSLLTGCGGSGSDGAYDEDGVEMYGSSSDGFFVSDQKASNQAAEESADGDSGQTSDIVLDLPGSVDRASVKIIYTADIWAETTDYEASVKAISEMVDKFDGYFELINTDNGSYYNDYQYRYAYYTIRVPSESYQKFVESVNEGLHVTQLNQNATDIGQQYHEIEGRLETLKNKHDRLEELLKKADKMKDIIEIEEALSETEYEIREYSLELNRYDGLVNYSTVNLTLEKVDYPSGGIDEDSTFFGRLGKSIAGGVMNLGYWAEDLLNWIGYYLIQIIIAAVILVLVIRKVLPEIRAKKSEADKEGGKTGEDK